MIEATRTREMDAAWMVALWLAVHGGDPAPEGAVEVDDATVLLAMAFASRLAERFGSADVDLVERLAAVGIVPCAHEAEPEGEVSRRPTRPGPGQGQPRCFLIDGRPFCVQGRLLLT